MSPDLYVYKVHLELRIPPALQTKCNIRTISQTNAIL